ncbi:MAG TPA: hypothetical protein VGQ48_02355 [Gemmatimonadales bacterium]|jgi:hypothetical protein|nr:hypothetical protein [Gemmatimonadales bacterium]
MISIRLLTAAAVFLLFAPAASVAQADPDRTVVGGGTIPPGWHVRTETNRQTGQPAPLDNVKFSNMGDGLHTTVGPAAIYWRDRDTISGTYHVVAKLSQMKNPAHPEAFGIFIGGKNLADSAQAYTYLLVRPIDGMYSIRRRAGYTTRPTAVVEWTASDAVAKADSSGRATNELSVEVRGGKAKFMVNGKEVYTGDAVNLDANGVVGYRVNHNLDVHLGPLGIHKL